MSRSTPKPGARATSALRCALQSIQLKMFGVICALMLALVAFLATYFPAQHVAAASRDLERKADTYARLVSRQVESAIAFEDQETVREVFEATTADDDVLSMGLYTAAGRPLHVVGELTAPAPVTPPVTPRIERLPTRLRATVAVVSREGPRGALVIELSTASIDVERERVRRAAVLAALPALALGLLAAWIVARSIGGRVRAVARVAVAVAAGDLSQPRLTDASADEVGQLARSFNDMMAEIQRLLARISRSAAEEQARLGQLVAARTEELRARNDDLRVVLDHVGEGFVTVDLDGVMSRERSATLTTWFGPADGEVTFWSYLAPTDAQAAASFQLGFEAIVDDFLPLELTLDQMPKEIHHGAHTFRVAYTPIRSGDALVKLMLVVSDVTHELERTRAEEEAHDLLNIFQRTRRDSEGLAAFLADTDPLVKHVLECGPGDELSLISREIHTLKGTSGMFGFPRLTRLCHELEGGIAESGEAPPAPERLRLRLLWEWIARTACSMSSDAPADPLPPRVTGLTPIRDLLLAGSPRGEILDLLGSLDFEPAERRLTRLAEHARSLAVRLDKPTPSVRVAANGVRLDAARWAPFWSTLVHLVRNAVDHGLESPADRARAGKPAAGSLAMTTLREGPDVVLEISDDGGGIDWSAVAARARSAGLPVDRREDLEAALFHDGMSTRSDVTEYSGRGVGLGAVRGACRDLGGSVELETVRGRGTTWRFRIPAASPGATRAYPSLLSRPPPPRARSASASRTHDASIR
ncbi:MAG: ATP-binding protein [Byssovorax sp.]